jgi:hypothetical protein
MRKERTLFVLGLLVTILPFSGFPQTWREVFFVIIGLGLICLAYLFYTEGKRRVLRNTTESKTFIDNIENTHNVI